MRFVSTNSVEQLTKEHKLRYEAFDSSLGYGIVKYGGFSVRFSATNVAFVQ
jgi:hypothetical protein